MIVKLGDAAGNVRLENADDFRHFHVETTESFDALTVAGIEPATDNESVWVSIQALRNWAGDRSGEWSSQFDGMVLAARSAGWLSDDGTSIRAHIEKRHV